MPIETIYRCRIYFDVTGNSDNVKVIDDICNKSLDYGTSCGLDECISDSGGPCWGASLLGESTNLVKLSKWQGMCERYISKRKGAYVE